MELPAVRLPNVNAPEPVAGAWSAVQRRLHGTYVVDEWGCDTEVLDAVSHLAKLRWQVSIGGAEHVPPFGPAVLVCNTRPFTAMPLLMALALHLRTGRAVRVAGVPDIAPFGPALRRIGGVLSRPDEVAGLLRAGHVVALACSGSLRRSERVGTVRNQLMTPALDTGAPVLPVAVIASPLARTARVEVGAPVHRRGVRGPLAEAELADAAREGVQRLLDEATPPRWLLGG
jgi:1-acyl-sn-glycerol-3-phosphate acyltransferase